MLIKCLATLAYVQSVKISDDKMSQAQVFKYPVDLAPRGDDVDTYEGAEAKVEVSDPYRAFEDPESEVTKTWVKK